MACVPDMMRSCGDQVSFCEPHTARPPRDRGAAAGLSRKTRACVPPLRNLGPLALSRGSGSASSGLGAVA